MQPWRSDQRLKLTHRRVREADGGTKNKPFKTPHAGKVIPSVLYLLNFWNSKTYCKHCCTYCSKEKGQQKIFLIELLVHFLALPTSVPVIKKPKVHTSTQCTRKNKFPSADSKKTFSFQSQQLNFANTLNSHFYKYLKIVFLKAD